jgi:hypothetical protein
MINRARIDKPLKTNKDCWVVILMGFLIPNSVMSNWDLSLGRIPTDCTRPSNPIDTTPILIGARSKFSLSLKLVLVVIKLQPDH